MIRVVPASLDMIGKLDLQRVQVMAGQEMTEDMLDAAIRSGYALAACDGDKVICLAGVMQKWEGVGVAWALFSWMAPKYPVFLYKAIKRTLCLEDFSRIECYVLSDHAQGMRLARHLGFNEEGLMRNFWKNRDYILFSMVA